MKQVIVTLALLCLSHANGQGLFETASTNDSAWRDSGKISFSGYVRGSAFGGSENYDFSNLFAEACLKGKLSGNRMSLFTDIRVRSGTQFGEAFSRLELKEAYAGYGNDRIDILLGNQVVAWGRTDGFNPTNNLTPFDYFFLSADPDDQKLSNFLLRARWRITPSIDLDLTGIPVFKPSVYRYDLFSMGENTRFTDLSLPGESLENSSFAARLNVETSRIGFSVSWFRGYDPFYGFRINSVDWSNGYPAKVYTPEPYLKNTAGADFALPLKDWILRGEFARDFTEGYSTVMHVPYPAMQAVIGLERTIRGYTAIVQYIGKYTPDFSPLVIPVLTDTSAFGRMQYANDMICYESSNFNRKIFHQEEQWNHAFSLTLSKPFAHETWNAECFAFYGLTTEEYILRPKATWKITDALSLSAGGSLMKGPEGSLFDYAGPLLNGVFIELKALF